MKRPKLSAVILLAAIAPAGLAQDLAFSRTKYSSVALHSKKIDVILTFTEFEILIKSRNLSKPPVVDLEIPYSSIEELFFDVRTFKPSLPSWLPPWLVGAPPQQSKNPSLAIKHHDGDIKHLTLLLTDKSEYQNIVTALQDRSAKQILPADFFTNSLVNPTVGSKNVDEVIPFGTKEIIAALKPAMESMGCKGVKVSPDRLRCKRPRGRSDLFGDGGESVTGSFEAAGEETRIRIGTGVGLVDFEYKKNWSTAIYREMMQRLQSNQAKH